MSRPGLPRHGDAASWLYFLPITTIVYAWMVTNGLPIVGFNLVLLIVAVLLDAGSHGGGFRYSQRRRV